jgi:hypothetical protein
VLTSAALSAAAAAAAAAALKGVQAGTGPLLPPVLLLLKPVLPLLRQMNPKALGGSVVADSCRSSTGAFLPPAIRAGGDGSGVGCNDAGVGVRSAQTHWLYRMAASAQHRQQQQQQKQQRVACGLSKGG